MSEEKPINRSTAPEDVIELAQSRRIELVSQQLDPKMELEVLRDLTKTAIDTKKAGALVSESESKAQLARDLMSVINSGDLDMGRRTIIESRVIPEIPESELEEFELVEDELSSEKTDLEFKDLFPDG